MEVIGTSEVFELEHEADVGSVRRRFAALAASAGLDENRASDAALIATEASTNVIKHARHGGALLACVTDGAARGVVLVAWDRGPGMLVDACLRDGMSTAGTAGAGLGAIARLASGFDAYSRLQRGAVVVATVFPRGERPGGAFQTGGVTVPYPGQRVAGDAWFAHEADGRATVIVVDGLGHGDGAHAAASAVIEAVRQRPDDPLPELLARADRAAHSTRGAAATLARIDRAARKVTIAGVGNVQAWIVGEQQRQALTQHGTLGQATPRIREESYPFPAGATLVMHSDGLKSRWELAEHPGLLARAPTTIAATLWRDLSRGRDDATVVVVREAA